ncbi:hypothetical protein MUK42_37629 [Musa troglodytarum]|uniref:Uncharacterized protein n=1 Tax=Musa troglodytarum TaxID=320322 RepID=A0A9E7HYQ8_9LILI|nr:hypothetical protein MUK42_37629 [Musa troglodytarum]
MGGRGRFRFYPPLRAIADLTDAWSERVNYVRVRNVFVPITTRCRLRLASAWCSAWRPIIFQSHSVRFRGRGAVCCARSCLTAGRYIARQRAANARVDIKVTPFPVMARAWDGGKKLAFYGRVVETGLAEMERSSSCGGGEREEERGE